MVYCTCNCIRNNIVNFEIDKIKVTYLNMKLLQSNMIVLILLGLHFMVSVV